MVYYCIFPCNSSFPSSKQLVQHYKNKTTCKKRWERRQCAEERAIFEAASARQRARVRETASNVQVQVEERAQTSKDTNGDIDIQGKQQDIPRDEHDFEDGEQNSHHNGADVIVQEDFEPVHLQSWSGESEIGSNASPVARSLHLDDIDYPTESSVEEENLDDVDGSPDIAAEFETFLYHNHVDNNDVEDHNPYAEANYDSDAEGEDEEEDADPTSNGSAIPGEISASDAPAAHDGYDDEEPLQDVDSNSRPLENDETDRTETFQHAGAIVKHGRPHYDTLLERHMEGGTNPYAPFHGFAEFELVAWLNGMPLSKVDTYLQLPGVSDSVSFHGSIG